MNTGCKYHPARVDMESIQLNGSHNEVAGSPWQLEMYTCICRMFVPGYLHTSGDSVHTA